MKLLLLFFQYYRCNISKLCPELSACFVKLALDAETQVFLDKSKKRASNVCLQVFYAAIQLLLGLFFSQTTINGYVDSNHVPITDSPNEGHNRKTSE